MIRPFHDDLLAAVARGVLVLTVNNRLSKRLHLLFEEKKRETGARAWRRPSILSFDAWVAQTASRAGIDADYPTSVQARRLWEVALDADIRERGDSLLNLSATAEMAATAHRLLVEYEADVAPHAAGEDHRAFLRWRRLWRDRCEARGWKDPCRLPSAVRELIASGRVDLPREIVVAGFDEIPPEKERILSAFKARGVSVNLAPCPSDGPPPLTLLPCADPEDEMRRCARWAKGLLRDGETRIGVVVADLRSCLTPLSRIFAEEISPRALLPWETADLPWGFSLGIPLSETGMVSAALAILRLGRTLALDEAGRLLRSPFVDGGIFEAHERAILDRELRARGEAQLSFDTLLYFSSEGVRGKGRSPLFHALLSRLKAVSEEDEQGDDGLSSARLPSDWADRFSARLAAAGWPGERSLDSRVYQTLSAMKNVLGDMASLDAVADPLPLGAAVSLFTRLCEKQEFQPDAPEAHIQVMGLLEAAGLDFDHLWLMGFHEGVFPPPPAANPFIPLPLQREKGMPHATAEREFCFASGVASWLFRAAPAVTASYPSLADGAEMRPSPLLREFDVAPHDAYAPVPLVGVSSAPFMETLVDSRGPSLPDGVQAEGGSSILADQSRCPFRAFALHRLAAKGLEDPSLGVDAATRGTLLHRALEIFWKETLSHGALTSLSGEELQTRVESSVRQALEDFEGGRRLPPVLEELEFRSLTSLLREWLDLEMKRAPFCVEEIEKRHTERVGDLSVRLRVDRVDRLEDSSRLLIDYKTGVTSTSGWSRKRLEEPQLPLYASVGDGDGYDGVAFASVRRGDAAFKGVARSEGLLPKVFTVENTRKFRDNGIESWDDLVSFWRESLEALARDFHEGAAAVDPVPDGCRYCDLQPFCRVGETAMSDEGEGES